MSLILISGSEDAALEAGGVSYTETLGTCTVQMSFVALDTSYTETYGTASAISVGAGAGVSQTWITQG